MTGHSIPAQRAAVETASAVLRGAKAKPRPGDVDFVVERLASAAETLRTLDAWRSYIEACGPDAAQAIFGGKK